MARARRPPKQWPAAKKRLLQILGKKRLSPTKSQRREQLAHLEAVLGYKPQKLSGIVGEPSRYTVKARVIQYDATGGPIGERLLVKRLSKSPPLKSHGISERGNHRTGSMVARAGKAKRRGGTRGTKPRREKKKRKKR